MLCIPTSQLTTSGAVARDEENPVGFITGSFSSDSDSLLDVASRWNREGGGRSPNQLRLPKSTVKLMRRLLQGPPAVSAAAPPRCTASRRLLLAPAGCTVSRSKPRAAQ